MTTAVAPKPASSQRRLNLGRAGCFSGFCSVILIAPYVILVYRRSIRLTLPFSIIVVACYEGLAKELWRECGEDVKKTASRRRRPALEWPRVWVRPSPTQGDSRSVFHKSGMREICKLKGGKVIGG